MREIKFRAWDKKEKVMSLGDISNIFFKPYTCQFGFIKDEKINVVVRCIEDVELLQYTGLKDKNGKEIFEGDIVKDNYGRIMEIVFTQEKAKFQFKLLRVEGEHFHWANNFMFADFTDWFDNGNIYVEVIGNIYENPELLGE